MQELQAFGVDLLPAGAPLSIAALLTSLVVGTLISIVLRWHFERFGSTLSNRSEFAQVFPLIVLTTVFIITVVKSSLALSLGLVGALSIVRFRTPIKEPEELAYLFIAIGTGLGLGADQIAATVLADALILTVVAALRINRRGRERTGLYLSIDWAGEDPAGTEGAPRPLDQIGELVSRHAVAADLRRVDTREGGWEITYFVDVSGPESVATMVEDLQASFPGMGLSFVDQNQLPSV